MRRFQRTARKSKDTVRAPAGVFVVHSIVAEGYLGGGRRKGAKGRREGFARSIGGAVRRGKEKGDVKDIPAPPPPPDSE